jgi:hypothetical protein
VPGDGRSGAAFERVTVDGMAYFVKRLRPASDWIMRVSGDQVHRPYLVWRAGIMDRAPAASITPRWRWTWTGPASVPCS